MMDKIKASLNYALCAFLGMFHFVMLAFNYLSAFMKGGGESEREGFANGYKMMKFADFKGSDAEALAVINGILQILLILVAAALLAIGVMGILKTFGVFKQFPDKVGKKVAGLAPLVYVGVTFLLFVLMLIWCGANTEKWGGYKIGFRAGFGIWFALFFSAALSAASFVLPKVVPCLKESAGGAQITYHCEKCGKKAGKDEKFCNVCGGAVVAEVVKQYDYVCSGCGKKMKKTDKFCNTCGGAVVAVEIKQMEYVCSGCGKKMKQTDKFCNVCGGAVVEREVAPAVAPVCPNCGKTIGEGQLFCTNCGTSL